MRRYARRGSTLIELVIVIAIVGLLIGLLLPAVQAAREAARRTQCSNNIKQFALGCLQHEAKMGFLPSGGWGRGWVGDPDRGFGSHQPGGWTYSVLRYIEMDVLREMGKGKREAEKKADAAFMSATPLALANCPVRRKPQVYPYAADPQYFNADKPNGAGRSDYAACAGSGKPSDERGPATLKEGDGKFAWACNDNNGVCYQRSEITPRLITDGMSNTYLLGERYLNPDHYLDGKAEDDALCMYVGHSRDVLRWTNAPPKQDRAGQDGHFIFGSAHPRVFNMALCDGSVRSLSYDIDPKTHSLMGSRNDGKAVDTEDL